MCRRVPMVDEMIVILSNSVEPAWKETSRQSKNHLGRRGEAPLLAASQVRQQPARCPSNARPLFENYLGSPL